MHDPKAELSGDRTSDLGTRARNFSRTFFRTRPKSGTQPCPKVFHFGKVYYFWGNVLIVIIFGAPNFGTISFLHYFTGLLIIVTPFVLFFGIFYLFFKIISYVKDYFICTRLFHMYKYFIKKSVTLWENKKESEKSARLW